ALWTGLDGDRYLAALECGEFTGVDRLARRDTAIGDAQERDGVAFRRRERPVLAGIKRDQKIGDARRRLCGTLRAHIFADHHAGRPDAGRELRLDELRQRRRAFEFGRQRYPELETLDRIRCPGL